MPNGFRIAEAFVELYAEDTGLRQSMAAKILAAAEGIEAKIRIEADGAGLREQVAAEVDAAGQGEDVKVGSELKDGGFREKVDALVASAGDKDVKIKVSVDDNGAVTKLEMIGAAARDAGNSAGSGGGGFMGMSGAMWAAVSAGVALGPVLAALPAILSGLGLAGGTLALGFGGIASALSAYGQQSASAGASSSQLAQTTFSNAVAIRNAQQTIDDARRQAAITAQNSADSIVAAEQQVASSMYAVQQAEQSLQNAEYSELQAQQALTQARQDATNALVDSQNAAADSHLATEQAALNVTRAQQNLTSVMSNSLSTDLQKQEAQLQLAQAQQGLIDAKQREVEATQKANQATANGVDHAPAVVSAQHQVQMAAEAVANAQHGVTAALQGQTNAQHALEVAQRNGAEAQRASTEQVAKAVQALADLKEQQALAAAAAASGAGGANAFAQAMAKLTPIGREFVNQLISMKGGFEELKATAQNTMLPGFLTMLRDMNPLLPIFNTAVGQMGIVLGDMGRQLGALFQNSQFQSGLAAMLASGTAFVQQITTSIAPALASIVDVAAKAAPITQALGGFIHDLVATNLPGFFQGLVSGADGAAQSIGAILGFLGDLLAPIGQLVGALSSALGPALALLRPILDEVVKQLVSAFLPVIKALSPVFTLLVQAVGALVPVFFPLLQVLSQMAVMILNQFTPMLKPLIPIIASLADTFGKALGGQLTALMPVLQALLTALGQVLPALMPIIADLARLVAAFAPLNTAMIGIVAQIAGPVITVIGQLVTKLLELVDKILNPVVSALTKLGGWFKSIFQTISDDTGKSIGFVKGHLDDVVSFFSGVPGRISRLAVGMWDGITSAFKSAINVIIRGWDSLHFHIPGFDFGPIHFGGFDLGVPQIPQLAAGGTALREGLAMVGERGPELLMMPKGASVVPLSGNTADAATKGRGDVHVHIANITVEGFVDLTNPNAMSSNSRKMMVGIRDGLRVLEGQYT